MFPSMQIWFEKITSEKGTLEVMLYYLSKHVLNVIVLEVICLFSILAILATLTRNHFWRLNKNFVYSKCILKLSN